MEVIPERDRLQRLIDTDVDCMGDPHALYNQVMVTTNLRKPPFVARPFVIGPGDLDELGVVNQANFIKWSDQARFEHLKISREEECTSTKGFPVPELPPIGTCALEFINRPSLGAEVSASLWKGDDPGSFLVEMSDAKTQRMYCRVVCNERTVEQMDDADVGDLRIADSPSHTKSRL